jgi:ketosteroid isomerase-like protein
MKTQLLSFATVLVLTLGGCAPQVDAEAERAAIRTFHDDCLAAQVTGDVGCFSEDGQMLPNEFPPIKGKSAIAEVVPKMIADPNFSVSHDVIDIDVSQSGDLGYIQYTYTLTHSDLDGNPATERGNGVFILKKQPQVGWRYVLDIANAAAEAAPASAE